MRELDYLEDIEEERRPEQKQVLIWTTIILFLLLLIVLVNLRFREITVRGNESYSDEEVIEMILPGKWDQNPVTAFVKHRILAHKEYPFVQSYSLTVTSPVSCEIILYEKKPLGYVDYMQSFLYFDNNGVIIESGSERREEIPEITGLKFGEIVMGKKLEVADSRLYDEIMNITSQLSVFGIPCRKIHFDQARNATLYIDDGSVKVNIGSDSYLATKLSVLSDVISEMRERQMKGTADLSGYNDRDSNGFIFIPD